MCPMLNHHGLNILLCVRMIKLGFQIMSSWWKNTFFFWYKTPWTNCFTYSFYLCHSLCMTFDLWMSNNASRWMSEQMGEHEQVSLLKWVGRNLWTYFMPCHGILLIYSSTTWILLSDMVEYFATSWNILWHGKIFSSKPWNNFPCHIHCLFWNQ